MKKIFSNLMFVAAAAMTFFACQKQEVNAPEYQSVDCLVFGSEKPSFNDVVKTEWTGETIHWSKDDKIRVAYTCDGVWQNAAGDAKADEIAGQKTAKLYASDGLDDVKDVATFVVPGNFKGNANGKYQFYGIYPSTLTSSADLKYAPSVAVDIPSVQTPVANSFDVAADVMVAQSDLYEGMPKDADKNGSISLEWKRLVAHGHITLKTLPVIGQEIVKSIVLTADNEADMVGKHDVNLDTQIVQKVGETATNSITINGTNLTLDDNGNVTFWACFLPCTWTSISIRVETDKATYTLERDLLALEKTKTFVKNARNVLTVNMSEASREVRTSASLPFVKDFSEMSGSEEITSLEGFSDIAGKVYKASGAIRLASNDADGSITTQLLDLSQNFHVKVTASGWDSDELSLIVSASDQTETVVLTTYGTSNAVGDFTEHIVNFQPVSNSASVTFKAVKKVRCHIKKIEILEGHAAQVPVLTASAPAEISADGGTGEFAYTIQNPIDGMKASAICNVDWITNVNVDDTKVTYTVAENTSEDARNGIITISYEGAKSVKVNINQAGKSAAGTVVDVLTRATTGVTKNNTSYSSWSGKNSNSNAVYAGNSAGGNDAIQLRSNNNNSGVVTTTSGGKVKKIKVTWQSSTSSDRTLDIYGKNTEYIAATDLYNSSSQGTKLGSIKCGTSTELVISGDYEFIGLRSNSGAMYLTEIEITWETGGSGGEVTPDPEPEQPTLTPRNLEFSSTTVTATVGQAFTAPTLDGVTTDVTYSSSNTAVATVNASTGAITLVAEGTTIITATAPATDQYEAGEASYTLTVNPAASSTTKWTRVTSVSELLAGGTFIIGYEATAKSGIIVPLRSVDCGAKTTANGVINSGTTKGSSTNSTIDMSTITNTSDYEVTISASTTTSGAINIKLALGSYVGNSGSKNTARLYSESSVNTDYTPTISTNDVIALKSPTSVSTSYTTLQYNTSSPRFCNYGGTQKNVVIYKKN